MKTKQFTLKALDVTLEDNDEFITFFDRNYLMFQNHLIIVHGEMNLRIEAYLKNKNLRYIVNATFKKTKTITNDVIKEQTPSNVTPELKDEVKTEKTKTTLKVLDKLIRSGQELNIEGDLLLLNRVNSGGTINIEGNLIITEIVEGSIRCNGDFMMLKASDKANILFHEVEVDNKLLTQRLNRIELKDNKIKITAVLKETNWG